MLKYKYPMLWACAKEICKINNKGIVFNSGKELRNFVKTNKHLLPEVVDGWKVG